MNPYVSLRADTGVCEILGDSILEDTYPFYKKIIDWLNAYFLTEKPLFFSFKLVYFNTSTSKCVLDILRLIKQYEEKGGTVQVYWYHQADDLGSKEDAEDFVWYTKIDINIISYDTKRPPA